MEEMKQAACHFCLKKTATLKLIGSGTLVCRVCEKTTLPMNKIIISKMPYVTDWEPVKGYHNVSGYCFKDSRKGKTFVEKLYNKNEISEAS